jgi:hypothetical protein
MSDFVIQFKSLFIIQEIESTFYKFLKQEFNSDNWDFIISLRNLEKLSKSKTYSKLYNEIEFINSTYIVTGSTKEVMVGKTHKTHILQ